LSEILIENREKREANVKNHTEVAGKQKNADKGKAKKKSTDAAGKNKDGKKKDGKKSNKKGGGKGKVRITLRTVNNVSKNYTKKANN
jgi:hypothetical protein